MTLLEPLEVKDSNYIDSKARKELLFLPERGQAEKKRVGVLLAL